MSIFKKYKKLNTLKLKDKNNLFMLGVKNIASKKSCKLLCILGKMHVAVRCYLLLAKNRLKG